MNISIALHVIGIAYWNVGVMFLTNLLKRIAIKNGNDETAAQLARKTAFGFVLPGVLLSVGSGLYQLMTFGMQRYFSQGWFHAKLTLVLLLIGVTVYCFKCLSNLSSLTAAMKGKFLAMHASSAMFFIVIVFLTILGR